MSLGSCGRDHKSNTWKSAPGCISGDFSDDPHCSGPRGVGELAASAQRLKNEGPVKKFGQQREVTCFESLLLRRKGERSTD